MLLLRCYSVTPGGLQWKLQCCCCVLNEAAAFSWGSGNYIVGVEFKKKTHHHILAASYASATAETEKSNFENFAKFFFSKKCREIFLQTLGNSKEPC
jgi:hypothetical protein